MIATITLNPALDKTLRTSRVVQGTVNRIEEVVNVAGGKGINVAKVLKQYGYDAKALGFLGGYTGEYISDTVAKIGAINKFTAVEGQTRTSINVITEDGYVTEYLEPGPEISESEFNSFMETYKSEIKDCDIVIISGSAPKNIKPEVYAELITIAKEAGKKVLLDTSGENLKAGVKALPFMIKPNMKELETLMGKRVQGMQEVCEASTALVKMGIPNVLVSMGSKGILYSKEGPSGVIQFYVKAPSIRVVNSVGSGDSAVAAFAMAVLEGKNPEETLKKCVAVSVANALSIENGIIPLEKAKEIEETLELCVPIY